MIPLHLHDFHQAQSAAFTELRGFEVVLDYGDPSAEYAAIKESAGILDLGFRSRLCLTGEDRVRFLNGQVTNDLLPLKVGEGCYAALVSAKGKIQSDANIYRLENEILLDFEPGYSRPVAERLEKYVIADDVQIVDAGQAYGLISVQGPKSAALIERLNLGMDLPARPYAFTTGESSDYGEIYLVNQPRGAAHGLDLFVPLESSRLLAPLLLESSRALGGKLCGFSALETIRIEEGIPRFGIDMDESNLAPEPGLDERAISYRKGCYIGQEVIARIRTYGQVAKALRGLLLNADATQLPASGDRLFKDGKDAGYVTSSARSPALNRTIALGYVRREANQIGTKLQMKSRSGELDATIADLPFRKNFS